MDGLGAQPGVNPEAENNPTDQVGAAVENGATAEQVEPATPTPIEPPAVSTPPETPGNIGEAAAADTENPAKVAGEITPTPPPAPSAPETPAKSFDGITGTTPPPTETDPAKVRDIAGGADLEKDLTKPAAPVAPEPTAQPSGEFPNETNYKPTAVPEVVTSDQKPPNNEIEGESKGEVSPKQDKEREKAIKDIRVLLNDALNKLNILESEGPNPEAPDNIEIKSGESS